MLGGALAGILLLVFGFWVTVVVNRLWQKSLYAQAEPAITSAESRGLVLRRPGLRARLVCEGVLEGRKVRVEWLGGVRGERSIVVRGRERRRVGFIAAVSELDAALNT